MIVLLCLLLGISAYLYQYGYEMKISEAQIQQKINAKLPFSKPYYVVFKGTLDDAEVELLQDKVRLRFNARMEAVNPKLLLNRIALRPMVSILSGSVDVVAIPEYRPETGQVFMSQVQVIGMDIKGARSDSKFEHSAQKLVTDYLATHPVYTLRENDFKKTIAKYMLKKVEVKGHELVLMFGV